MNGALRKKGIEILRAAKLTVLESATGLDTSTWSRALKEDNPRTLSLAATFDALEAAGANIAKPGEQVVPANMEVVSPEEWANTIILIRLLQKYIPVIDTDQLTNAETSALEWLGVINCDPRDAAQINAILVKASAPLRESALAKAMRRAA